MKITIIGGGNIGTLMAAEMAIRGNNVTVYTEKAYKWDKNIDVFDADNNYIMTGNLYSVTDDIKEAVQSAEIIWITVPAQVFNEISNRILPYVKKNQLIGIVPGSGGAEFAFYPLLQKGCKLFGLQRVHSIARLKEYGKSVYMLGRKSELQIGTIPKGETEYISNIVYKLLDIPCVSLPNYLCVTLTPSNPILHTTRLYSMFKDYTKGMYYPRNFLFYEEWNDDSSRMLFACDEELQKLCEVMPFELSNVKSLKKHYESETIVEMTKKIQSIKAFKGLSSPMKMIEANSFEPDFESRYFTADFSYGLKIILDLCELFQVDVPNIKRVWDWYISTSPIGKDKYFNLLLTIDDLINLYD